MFARQELFSGDAFGGRLFGHQTLEDLRVEFADGRVVDLLAELDQRRTDHRLDFGGGDDVVADPGDDFVVSPTGGSACWAQATTASVINAHPMKDPINFVLMYLS